MKILAVDDDPIILELMVEIFRSFGAHTLVTCQSGAEAIDIARQDPTIQCFLLDIQMPAMNGIELCRRLRGIPAYTRTPILMITAMTEKHYVDAAFSSGATDYISKPFDISELRGRISLIDGLVSDRARTDDAMGRMRLPKVEAARDRLAALRAPFEIHDVPGLIDESALENYLMRLSRSALFGSSVTAFAIHHVQQHFNSLSLFDFQSLVVDVAEALSDSMGARQFLMAYLGNGIFGCVSEDGAMRDTESFLRSVQTVLHHMDLHSSDGTPLRVQICAGKSIRLVWRSGQSAVEALAECYNSAGEAADRIDPALDKVWFLERSA